MKEPRPSAAVTRKSVSLPDSVWAEVADYRFSERISSETEAIRRLVIAGLRAEARKAAPERPDSTG